MDSIFAKDVWVAPVSTASSDKFDSDAESDEEPKPKKRKNPTTNQLLSNLLEERKISREQQKQFSDKVTSLLEKMIEKY